MTTDTRGWDLVAGITQSALNREIALLSSKGYLPTRIQQSIEMGEITGSIDLTLGCATVDLSGVTPGMAVLSLPVIKGKLIAKKIADFDLTEAIIYVSTAVNQIEIETEQKQKQILVYLDLLSKQMCITAKVKGGPKLKPIQEIILNAMLMVFFESLSPGKYYLGSVTLSGIDIPVYLMPRTAAFSIVPSSASADLNDILVLAKTVGHGGQKPFTESVVPKGSDAALVVSNERLLTNAVGGPFAEQIKGATFAYSENNYHMTNSVPFKEYQLRNAWIFVKDGAIHIKLDIAAMHQAGGGLNIFVQSDTTITVTYDPKKQQFIPTSNTPDPTVSSSFEWWVWLIVGLSGILVPFIGAIVALIIALIVKAIAESVAKQQAQQSIDKIFKSALLPIRWPAGALLEPTLVSLPGSLQILGKVP